MKDNLLYSEEELSSRLKAGLQIDGSRNKTHDSVHRNERLNNISLNLDHDVIDWSDEGEEDDDTPRNHDLLSRLAEESEDDCDQDVLQFSRYQFFGCSLR